jgi:deferrochelatase/peroxidase EfeB
MTKTPPPDSTRVCPEPGRSQVGSHDAPRRYRHILQTGHIFVAYQQDVRRQFETIRRRLIDEPLIDYLRPFGGSYFYVPPGVTTPSDWYGRTLLT